MYEDGINDVLPVGALPIYVWNNRHSMIRPIANVLKTKSVLEKPMEKSLFRMVLLLFGCIIHSIPSS